MEVRVTDTMYAMHCSETIEHAYVFNGVDFYTMSWLKQTSKQMTDVHRVEEINNKLQGKKCQVYITGKVHKGLVEIYLEDIILVPENKIYINPKHLFIQRWVPQTKTFDLVVIDQEYNPIVINAIPKSDIDVIQHWYPHDIFCGGADPLPIKAITSELKKGVTYEYICEQLGDDSSDSDWTPDSD
jgi:hypothetical protein|tara:strand:- start:1718 stop:2272 length:555 start_codon:yes stop_codon:yes gene_type:complete